MCVWFGGGGGGGGGGGSMAYGKGGGGGGIPGHTEKGARFPPVATHPKCSKIFTFIKPAAVLKMRKSLVLNC